MSIERAVEHILMSAGLKPIDRLVIVGDDAIVKATDELQRRARALGVRCTAFNLDRFGKRPLPKLPDEVARALDDCSVVLVMVRAEADDKVNELQTVRRPIALHSDTIKHINMPGVTYEVLESAMQVDPQEMWAFTRRVFEVVHTARELVVTGANGTNVRFRFDPQRKWVNSSGDYRERFVVKGSNNLPGAEVYTAPLEAEGVFVVDGVVGDHFAHRYGVIGATPVTLELAGGRVVRIRCANAELQAGLERYVKTDENADRIGELGIGTNRGLARLLGNMLHDEKFPSVHIAAGSPYSHVTGADWESDAHCDFITLAPNIDVDGRRIMEAGRHLL